MRFSILALLLLALVTLSTAVNVGGLRRRRQRRALSDESKSKLKEEFKGIKVVSVDSKSEKKGSDSASSPNLKTIRPGSFPSHPKLREKFAPKKTRFHGKEYRRPLAQPDACCCACKSLPCVCSCDSAPDTTAEFLKLGKIVDTETKTDEERRQRERAERKAKRKAERKAARREARREQKRLEREKQRQEEERRKKEAAEHQEKSTSIDDEDSTEESKEGQSGRRLGSMSSARALKAARWKHYTESSVLCACCQCSSYPCTCRANMLVFRMDNV